MAHEALDIIDRIDVGIPGPNGEPGKKGDKGETGTTPDLTLTASVDNQTGTPNVTVTKSGTPEAPEFTLAFSNIKGDKGEQGKQGDPGKAGETGTTPDLTLTASIGKNTGTPTINVTKTGTPEAPTYALAFDGLKAESVKPATAETAGVVKPGANLTITADGTLDAPSTTIITNTDALPTGLPKGSVVIQLGNGEAKFYVEDGKEGA